MQLLGEQPSRIEAEEEDQTGSTYQLAAFA
jgi:hypothetical protein